MLDYLLELRRHMPAADNGQGPLIRIYEAEVVNLPTLTFYVSVSEEREGQLREEIILGRKRMRLRDVVYETRDPALARSLSDTVYA